MSYPYGKREKVTLVWCDGSKASKIPLRKCTISFEGSKKHCAEQLIRWLIQKGFLTPFQAAFFVCSLDLYKSEEFTLFGKLLRNMGHEENAQILGQKTKV